MVFLQVCILKPEKNKDYVFIDSLNKDVEVKILIFRINQIPACEMQRGSNTYNLGIDCFSIINVNPD